MLRYNRFYDNGCKMVDTRQETNIPDPKSKAVILLTDMVSYSQKTAHMNPEEIRDFIIDYHKRIHSIICIPESEPVVHEASAGDGAIIIFKDREDDTDGEKCQRALNAAVDMALAMKREHLQDTRIGIYCGDIIEAKVNEKIVKFGTSFAVASRLEDLCNYFAVPILMDKEMAKHQERWADFLVHIGKVTPKNLSHPIHVVGVYPPELYNCTTTEDERQLLDFIALKNTAIEHFCGNIQEGIISNFPLARELLKEAQEKFVALTGKRDVPTDRVLDYIRETPYPGLAFFKTGMELESWKDQSFGSRLFRLSKQLLRAMDLEFYNALVVDTTWEEKFKIEWWKKGDTIIRIGEKADGIFYIDSGDVNTINSDGEVIATLAAGDIFGEMAYFTEQKRRNATIVANSDVVLRRISTEDFSKLPTIKKIFQRIAQKRIEEQD